MYVHIINKDMDMENLFFLGRPLARRLLLQGTQPDTEKRLYTKRFIGEDDSVVLMKLVKLIWLHHACSDAGRQSTQRSKGMGRCALIEVALPALTLAERELDCPQTVTMKWTEDRTLWYSRGDCSFIQLLEVDGSALAPVRKVVSVS